MYYDLYLLYYAMFISHQDKYSTEYEPLWRLQVVGANNHCAVQINVSTKGLHIYFTFNFTPACSAKLKSGRLLVSILWRVILKWCEKLVLSLRVECLPTPWSWRYSSWGTVSAGLWGRHMVSRSRVGVASHGHRRPVGFLTYRDNAPPMPVYKTGPYSLLDC